MNAWEEDFIAVAPSGWSAGLGGAKYPRLYLDEWLFDSSGPVDTKEAAELELIYVSQIDVETLLNGDLMIEFKRRGGSDDALKRTIYDTLYGETLQTHLRELANEHNLDLADRTDGVHVFQTPVSLNIGQGETIGGQLAQRICDLKPVNDAITQALSEINWPTDQR